MPSYFVQPPSPLYFVKPGSKIFFFLKRQNPLLFDLFVLRMGPKEYILMFDLTLWEDTGVGIAVYLSCTVIVAPHIKALRRKEY